MEIKAIFKEGVFQPLRKIKNVSEGQIIEINIETSEKDALAEISMQSGSFDFLENEEDIYSKKDLI
ncbi:MAG: antitoxin AF2212-like protein [Nanoarchaeota archaeon]